MGFASHTPAAAVVGADDAPRSWIDCTRYPVTDLASLPGRTLLARCREALAETGACELPGFLTAAATAQAAAEAASLAPLAHRHRGAATAYLEVPAPGFPEGHPRRRFHPYSLGAVAYDGIPSSHLLHRLYAWDPLMAFVAAALDVSPIHRYADPLGALNVAVMGDGDELEWHFDQTDFVVSLALQDSERGGDFLYAPRIRSREDERYEAVERVLDGDGTQVRRIPMEPGALLLFEGRFSLHCVSRCEGATPRLVALLAYDTKAGTCASPLLQQARYGRVRRPESEAAGQERA